MFGIHVCQQSMKIYSPLLIKGTQATISSGSRISGKWGPHFFFFFLLFSAPEPKAQVHYFDHALSVVRPSSVRPSLTFHIFDFSFETTEQNSTKLNRKQELNVLYQVFVFRVDRKNKTAVLASDWLRYFQHLF